MEERKKPGGDTMRRRLPRSTCKVLRVWIADTITGIEKRQQMPWLMWAAQNEARQHGTIECETREEEDVMCIWLRGSQPRKAGGGLSQTAGMETPKRKLAMKCWISGQIWMIDIILGVAQQNGKEEWRGDPGGEGRRTWANLRQSVPLEDWGAGSAGQGHRRSSCRDRKEWPGCKRSSRGQDCHKFWVLQRDQGGTHLSRESVLMLLRMC